MDQSCTLHACHHVGLLTRLPVQCRGELYDYLEHLKAFWDDGGDSAILSKADEVEVKRVCQVPLHPYPACCVMQCVTATSAAATSTATGIHSSMQQGFYKTDRCSYLSLPVALSKDCIEADKAHTQLVLFSKTESETDPAKHVRHKMEVNYSRIKSQANRSMMALFCTIAMKSRASTAS